MAFVQIRTLVASHIHPIGGQLVADLEAAEAKYNPLQPAKAGGWYLVGCSLCSFLNSLVHSAQS